MEFSCCQVIMTNYSDFVIINLSFSTVSEWVMALSLDLSILSLVPEFKLLTFAEPKIIVNIEPRGFMNIDQDHQEDNSTDYYSQSNSSESFLARGNISAEGEVKRKRSFIMPVRNTVCQKYKDHRNCDNNLLF